MSAPTTGFGFYRPVPPTAGDGSPPSAAAEPSAVAAGPSAAGGSPTGAIPPTRAEPLAAAEPLAPGTELDLSADDAARLVEATLETLDRELIGLTAVKRRVREIASLLLIDRARERFGLAATRPTLHMSFTGGPGTGKTTVALRMATILHALGYLKTPRVHTVTRDDLVGQFIGHTAPKTKEAIAKAAGGVLFIDEAYYLHRPDNERDYGQEVVEILLTEMEKERGSLVVIFAGYADRMEQFFGANPGLRSRVPHHLEFPDYEHAELMAIADQMVDAESFRLTDDARAAFAEYLTLRMSQGGFANARSVRNAIERLRLRQARRLVELDRPLNRADLVTFTAQDVLGSHLFERTPVPADDAGPDLSDADPLLDPWPPADDPRPAGAADERTQT